MVGKELKEYNMWKFSGIQVSVSINKVRLGHSLACAFVLTVAAFTAQRQSGVAVTETCLQNRKYSLSGPLQNKFAGPCDRESLALGVGRVLSDGVREG